MLVHGISTQAVVNKISTGGRIVHSRSMLLNTMLKSIGNRSNQLVNLKQNKTKTVKFLPECLCSYDKMCDIGSSVNQSSLQSAHQVKRGIFILFTDLYTGIKLRVAGNVRQSVCLFVRVIAKLLFQKLNKSG